MFIKVSQFYDYDLIMIFHHKTKIYQYIKILNFQYSRHHIKIPYYCTVLQVWTIICPTVLQVKDRTPHNYE